MLEPATTRTTRDAIAAGHKARADALASVWTYLLPRRR